MSSDVISENQIVFFLGETSDSMHFLREGCASLCDSDSKRNFAATRSKSRLQEEEELKRAMNNSNVPVTEGHYVSEAGLWTKWQHTATMQCREDARLLHLQSTKFAEVLQTHSGLYKLIVFYAFYFVSEMNER